MKTQKEKGEDFKKLHERDSAFLIPNPWDIGTVRLLEYLGFEALASTSAGFAFSSGQADGMIGCERMMDHLAEIAASTSLPISADLEDCFGDDPDEVAKTISLCIATGCVGASIEDLSSRGGSPRIYDFDLAVERVRAASEVTASMDFPFTLTARCENYLVGNPDLKDTINRLQAFQMAGADVLYAPGLSTKEDIETVVRAVEKPVNVVMGLQGARLTIEDLSNIGVKRISVGSGLTRAALGSFIKAAKEMKETGTFTFADDAISYQELNQIFQVKTSPEQG